MGPPSDTERTVAFRQLAESSRPYLKKVAARMLGGQLAGKVDASDVVQECLMAAYQDFDRCRGQTVEEQRAWLVGIVRNQVLNLRRYWGQQVRDRDRERPLPAGPGGGEQLAGDSSSPSQQALRREQASRILAVLERLPADYHDVIALRDLEELPFAEVARRMGRSEEAVRWLWLRAVKRLKTELGDEP